MRYVDSSSSRNVALNLYVKKSITVPALAPLEFVGAGLAIIAWKERSQGGEGKALVDAAILAIELINPASSALKQTATPADVDRLFCWFRTLGKLRK